MHVREPATLRQRALDPERPLPALAVAFVLALGVAAALMLLMFIGHVAKSLRVDTMMAAVHGDTVPSARAAYPERGDGPAPLRAELPGPDGGTLVPTPRSGFALIVDPEPLVRLAVEQDLLTRLGVRPGDSVVTGAPMASVWSYDRSGTDPAGLGELLRRGVSLGHERTEEQDVGFGFRQLVDIAVRAIPPGINDPTTAAEAIAYCAELLVLLQGRRLGAQSWS